MLFSLFISTWNTGWINFNYENQTFIALNLDDVTFWDTDDKNYMYEFGEWNNFQHNIYQSPL